MIDLAQLRSNLKSRAPNLWKGLGSLAKKWTATALDELDAGRSHAACPKMFNDPIWGVVELQPWETLLLDSPLLQRRGVRQFGMAHLVYPGAGLDRLGQRVCEAVTEVQCCGAIALSELTPGASRRASVFGSDGHQLNLRLLQQLIKRLPCSRSTAALDNHRRLKQRDCGLATRPRSCNRILEASRVRLSKQHGEEGGRIDDHSGNPLSS